MTEDDRNGDLDDDDDFTDGDLDDGEGGAAAEVPDLTALGLGGLAGGGLPDLGGMMDGLAKMQAAVAHKLVESSRQWAQVLFEQSRLECAKQLLERHERLQLGAREPQPRQLIGPFTVRGPIADPAPGVRVDGCTE